MKALLLSALLGSSSALAPAPSDAPTPTLSELLLSLGQAQILANEDPELGIPKLEAVLESLVKHPEALAGDDAAQRARIDALLILARAKLNTGDEAGAAASLDEAIRCAHGAEIDAASLGPAMSELEAGRREALSARGTLRVQCTVPCRIYVDERETPGEAELPEGQYRVHIVSADGQYPDLDTEVEVGRDGPVLEVVYGPVDSPDPEAGVSAGPDLRPEQPELSPRTNARFLPRWAEVTGIVVGAAGIAAGATLLTLDGRCQGGGSVDGPGACDDIYNTDIAGFSALGGGAAILVGSGVLLTVDELRVRKGQLASINVSATFRF